ncbi:M28 family peptidase [Gammaproteobacteria bacterium]|jgi:Zn-dependent M28 family amino/carboxypeptidase|nr:M28 family peptidase [Gammaproteobacteria bacterium]MDC1042851.1 M28 family peptidase [Gammaproteobacteria bacterium]
MKINKIHSLLFLLGISIFISNCSDSLSDTTDGRLRYWISTLSSDEFEGRAPGTEGGQLTKNFISKTFQDFDLDPVDGSYFLDVPASEITLKDSSYLTLSFRGNDRKMITGDEVVFWTKQARDYRKIRDSEVVFVGYGIVAPEYNWNDYEGVDVKGKTVVILINDPGFATGKLRLFNGRSMTYYGRWTYKFEEAARQGAAAAIIVHEEEPAAYPWSVVENSWQGPQLDLQRDDLGADRVILEGWIKDNILNDVLNFTGFDYDSLKQIALEKTFSAFPLRGLTLSSEIHNKVRYLQSHNIAAVKKGIVYPDEYILFMAHWDHLGMIDSTQPGENNIMNGAVDNATGVAAILEFAKRFSEVETDRSIMFLAVTLEESGLLGSEYFAKYPPIDLANIVAGFNYDGILPTGLTNDMVVVGYGASELEDLLENELAKSGRYINPDPNPEKGYFYRSDHISFAKRGVPVLYADGGFDLVAGGKEAGFLIEEQYRVDAYHGVADEYDESWDLDGLNQSIDVIFNISNELANSQQWPNWYDGNEFKSIRDASREGK